jgi:uncharacterized cofD-like protein
MKKIITIGGGTGHYTLLRGLKNYDVTLTSVVSVVDNGGSSGKLRTEFGILPPGDLRNCLLALTDEVKLKDLKELFDYRFEEGKELKGHSMGNLILTALTKQHGDIAKAVKVAGEILNIKNKILPVSINKTHLYGETKSGKKLSGQLEVSYPNGESKIKKIWLEPPAFIYKEAAEEIRNADLIIICPGDLYGSILPNFLVEGVKEAINESKAKVVYICNLVTKQGTKNFRASDFKKEIEKYGIKIDFIICNTKKPEEKVVDKYREENSYFVEPDLDNAIKQELLETYQSGGKTIARHNPEKTTKIIMEIIGK